MSATEFIWIARWEEFQHYPPERDRAPAWIKAYTKPLSDDRYRNLTPVQRALLHDLRSEFSRAHGRLTSEPRRLTQRLGFRVTSAQLEALNHAGFIELLSRESLEVALEKFYTSRARDRAHQREVEKDGEQEQDTPTPEGSLVSEKSKVQVKTLRGPARETDNDDEGGVPLTTNGHAHHLATELAAKIGTGLDFT